MSSLHRREFLGTSAALAAGLAVPVAAAGPQPKSVAGDKLRVGLVGCGGMGRADLHDFMRLPEVEITALCDVDTHYIHDAMKDVEKAKRPTDRVKTCQDFRKVIPLLDNPGCRGTI